MCVYYMTGTPEGSTESGFMAKPGIEPATPGLQGIALIHYTTGASFHSVVIEKGIFSALTWLFYVTSIYIYDVNFKIILAFYLQVQMLVLIVIKSLQSMSSSVEYIIIKSFN